MRLRRLIRWSLIGIGSLILLVGIAVTVVFSSQWAAEKAVDFGVTKMAGLEIGSVEGRLCGPLILRSVRYRSETLRAEVDSILLDWRPLQLFRRRAQIDRLHITGVRVTMVPAPPGDTATQAASRERPSAPVDVVLGDVWAKGITVIAPDSVTMTDGSARVTGRLEDYRLELGAKATAPRVGPLRIHVNGHGNLEAATITRASTTLLGGQAFVAGEVHWWPLIRWELAVAGDGLEPARALPDSTMLPGAVSFHLTTAATMNPGGVVGHVIIDSLGGILRGQPFRGRAEIGLRGPTYQLQALSVGWGTARLEANGFIADTIALSYDALVADLRTAMPEARGMVTVRGTARGPRASPRIDATLGGQRLAYGTARLDRLTGKLDLDLAPTGRINVDLRGDAARIAARPIERILMALHGTRGAHRLTVDAVAPADTLHLAAVGGLVERSWRGRIEELTAQTAAAGPWRLEQPAAVAASAGAARLDPLCLTADTLGGRICAEGAWRGGTNWNALATLEGVPLTRVPTTVWNRARGGRAAFGGVLGARLEARSAGGRMDATLRATSDTVAFVYREGSDTVVRRLTLDSAVVDGHADRGGLRGTLGFRVLDNERAERAVLSGRVEMPNYRIGAPIGPESMTALLEGRIDDVSFARPLFNALDSLAGGMRLNLTATGTVATPTVDGRVRVERLVVGLPGRQIVKGSADLTAKGTVAADRTIDGEVRLVPDGLRYEYQRLDQRGALVVDRGSAVIRAGREGVRGIVELSMTDGEKAAVATVAGRLDLPTYRRLGTPLGLEPVQLELEARIPDLAVLQPFAMQVDSLAGTIDLTATAKGTVAAPTATAALRMTELRAHFPFGTTLHGGVSGDLDLKVAPDSTIVGSLRLAPEQMRLVFQGAEAVRFDSTIVEVRAGGDGVHGRMNVVFVDSVGAAFGTIRGTGDLPEYTRVGSPLAQQPVRATLTGQITDIDFIKAFTPQVDSAGGRVDLDARLDGALGESHLVGGVDIRDVVARLPVLGILLQDFNLAAKGDQAGSISIEARMKSGGGDLTVSGTTPVQPSSAEPGRLTVQGNRFEAANNSQVHAVVTPKLEVRLAADSIDIKGTVDVPLTRIALSELPQIAVAVSDDIILVDTVVTGGKPRPVSARVRVNLGDSVSFRGFNFDAEFGGSIEVTQLPNRRPTATGQLTIEEGHYKAYGQDLTIENGVIRFAGPVDNPGLSIRAVRKAQDSTVAGIAIAGTLKEPRVSLFADSAMSQNQILSYILTGRPIGDGSGSGSLATKALNSLGLRGGNLLAASVGKGIGLDEAKVVVEGDIKNAAFVAGRYLSPNLYLSYGIGLFDPISTLRLRYVLSSTFSLQAETGRATGADILIKSDKR